MKKRAKSSVVTNSGRRAGIYPERFRGTRSTKGAAERRAEPARPTKATAGRDSERGIALILTLAILVLVTLLVVAFAVSMRVENTASKNFNDLIKARQLAQAAVDQAVATIRFATPVPTNGPTMISYVTSPGVIYTLGNNAWVQHLLSTPLITLPNNTGTVDMNQNSLITGTGNADFPPANSQIWVGWQNIVVPVNGTPQAVGRIAYWVDDEAAKVNLNVAGTRGNDLEGYASDAIELPNLNFSHGLLLPNDVNNITNYVATARPFDTIQSMELTNVSTPTYSNNQFYVTVKSTSPDLTPWGTKRTNFVDVATNLFLTADQKVLIISNALDNLNLTAWFGQTFAAKYNVAQIAANIIDYIDTDNQPTEDPVSTANPSGSTPPAYLGLEQTPYFNELAVSNQIVATPIDAVHNTATLTVNTKVFVELWQMYTNNWAPVLGQVKMDLLALPTITISPVAGTPPTTSITFSNIVITGLAVGGPTHNLSTNKPYDVVTANLATSVLVSGITGPTIVNITVSSGSVTSIYFNSAGRLDYAVIPLVGSSGALTIDPVLQEVANFNTYAACNDPRVKPVSNDWTPEPGGIAPFGTASPALNPTLPSSVAADGDFSCHTNTIPRDRGTMYPGELSYIHTGLRWRTFWLQPQAIGESAPPDWAALDLFSATDVTNVVGRMNINSAVAIPNAPTFPKRLLPLTALLTNTFTTGSGTLQNSYNQATATLNVYGYPSTVAPVVSPPGSGTVPFCLSAFTMVGEVANTQSLSDTQVGVPPTGTSKSNRETPVRGVANLITTRSDTFTVWAIAQTIKDVDKDGLFNPAKGDSITGEAKVQAIVQRSVDYTVFPPQVSFRTLYYRYIYQ